MCRKAAAFEALSGGRNLNQSYIIPTTSQIDSFHSPHSEIRDDIADVSNISAMSLSVSYSVNPNLGLSQSSPQEMFANHAHKIYYKENERHWRRISERLQKVGVTKLLGHISFDDEKEKDSNTKPNRVEFLSILQRFLR